MGSAKVGAEKTLRFVGANRVALARASLKQDDILDVQNALVRHGVQHLQSSWSRVHPRAFRDPQPV